MHACETAPAAGLADRDPALGRLRDLLDDPALSGWLSDVLGTAVTARSRYRRYKPGTSLVLRAELDAPVPGLSEDERDLVVQHWAPAARSKVAKAAVKAPLGSLLHLDVDRGLVVTTPAADRHLPGLRRLLDARARADLVTDLLGVLPGDEEPPGASGPPGAVSVHTLSYKPQRRWVGALDLPGRRLLVRAFPPAELSARVAGARHLRGTDAPVARLLQLRRRHGLAVFDWAHGDTLTLPADEALLPDLGVALARLHAPDGRPVPASRTDRVAAVLSTTDLAATLVPWLRPRLDRLAATCARELTSLPAAPVVTVHGDLSPDQVIRCPDGSLRLVDLDRSRAGEAGDDLGSLVASFLLAGHGADGPEGADGVAAAVAAGYGAAWPAPRVLTTWTLVQLLLRCTESFRTAAPDWSARLLTAVELAEDTAARLSRPAPRPARHPLAAARAAADRVDLDLLRAVPRPDRSLLLALGRRGTGGGEVAGRWDDTGLHVLAGGDPGLPALRGLLAEGGRLVAHRAGRRAVVRHPGGQRWTKVVPARRASGLADGLRRAATWPGVRVPEVLACDPAAGTVTLATLPGVTLHDVMGARPSPARLIDAGGLLGAALARLHAVPLEGTRLPRHDLDAEIALTRRWQWQAVELAGAEPHAGPPVTHEHRPTPPVVLHRDLHDKQVLLDDGPGGTAVGLLDLDLLAAGEAALDLANLLVHLELRVRQGLLGAGALQPMADAVLAAYEPSADVRRGLPLHSHLARLRLRAVHAFRPADADAAVLLTTHPLLEELS